MPRITPSLTGVAPAFAALAALAAASTASAQCDPWMLYPPTGPLFGVGQSHFYVAIGDLGADGTPDLNVANAGGDRPFQTEQRFDADDGFSGTWARSMRFTDAENTDATTRLIGRSGIDQQVIQAPVITDGVPRNYNLQRLHAKGVLPTQANDNLVRMLFVHDSVGMAHNPARLGAAIKKTDLNFIGFFNPMVSSGSLGLYRVSASGPNTPVDFLHESAVRWDPSPDRLGEWEWISGTGFDATYGISLGHGIEFNNAANTSAQAPALYAGMDWEKSGVYPGSSLVNSDAFWGGFLIHTAPDGWRRIQTKQAIVPNGNPFTPGNWTATGPGSDTYVTEYDGQAFQVVDSLDVLNLPAGKTRDASDDAVGYALTARNLRDQGRHCRLLGWYMWAQKDQANPKAEYPSGDPVPDASETLPDTGLYFANIGGGGMNAWNHLSTPDGGVADDVVEAMVDHCGGYELVMIKLSLNGEPFVEGGPADKANNLKDVAERWKTAHTNQGLPEPEILIVNSYNADGTGWGADDRAAVWDMIQAQDYALIDLWGLYGGDSPGLLDGYTMDGGGTGVHPDDAETAELIMQDILDQMDPAQFCTDPCPADLNDDGAIDFEDLNAFTAAFQAGDPDADLNGDGSVGFEDLNAFVTAFAAGCP